MSGRLSWRFWLETVMGVASGALAVLTIIWSDWIELVFNIDPDQHNGSAEWLIVAIAVAVALASALLARREWRRALCA